MININITDGEGTLLEQVKVTEGTPERSIEIAKQIADLIERNFECDLGNGGELS